MCLCIFSYDLFWIMNELLLIFGIYYAHVLLKNENNIFYVWSLKKIASL